jgi:hypothetical protein
METNNLKALLDQLHADLQESGKVDPELRQPLQTLQHDIDKLLGSEQRDRSSAKSLAERSQNMSARFAARHPRIEAALRELGMILEGIGI